MPCISLNQKIFDRPMSIDNDIQGAIKYSYYFPVSSLPHVKSSLFRLSEQG